MGEATGLELSRLMTSERASQRAFLGVSALLFAGSTAVTVLWCASMSARGEMPMPGGWTMSMAWMRMPGQSWAGATATFLGMWSLMMVAMMMPSLVPMLQRYRQAVGGVGEPRLGRLTALVGVTYFLVWTVVGAAAFPLGVALAAIEMRQPALARAVPVLVGLVVLIAGSVQLTAWKARHLACCRQAPGCGAALAPDAGTAWRHGLRLGLHCCLCCAGLMAVLLAVGVMDLRAMAGLAAAIALERIAPAGERLARGIGVVVIGAGVLLLARAAGLGCRGSARRRARRGGRPRASPWSPTRGGSRRRDPELDLRQRGASGNPDHEFHYRQRRRDRRSGWMADEPQRPEVENPAGKLRVLGFRNVARMGSFRDALRLAAAQGGVPDVASVRRDQAKAGFGVGLEQSLLADVAIFGRFSVNDGATETYAFTEIERSLTLGASAGGAPWGRRGDTLGLAWVQNELSAAHQAYVAAQRGVLRWPPGCRLPSGSPAPSRRPDARLLRRLDEAPQRRVPRHGPAPRVRGAAASARRGERPR